MFTITKDYIILHNNNKAYQLFSRDLVHRQTACWAVKHMALGVYGFGCEDALTHLMNYVWPNIFEISPHMVQSFNDAVDGFRVAVGPGKVLQYTLQVRREGGREGGRMGGKEGERGREEGQERECSKDRGGDEEMAVCDSIFPRNPLHVKRPTGYANVPFQMKHLLITCGFF